MKLWGGRFSGELNPDAWALNASIDFDRRLAGQDVRVNQAWARALERARLLTPEEASEMRAGLSAIAEELQAESFVFQETDEDVHTAIERRLGELIGPLAGKLHTGCSRNDLVATDLRLWLLEKLPMVDSTLVDLQSALVERAEGDFGVLMPGYTHMQRAQAILLSHWWLSHFWPLQRDRQRFAELRSRCAVLPLGSAALAGTSFSIDRDLLAEELGFDQVSQNSIDAVSDRDFGAEFLFCAALVGVHLSRLAEAVILFSSNEFGYFELSDSYATGSSLMPQKKNPDVFELARGKSGGLIGSLVAFLTMLKGLPSAYDKDLQEDKVPLFQAYDTLALLVPVLGNAVRTMTVHAHRMQANVGSSLLATDLADYLVRKGLAFREAHSVIGLAVKQAISLGKELDELGLADFQAIHPYFDADVLDIFNPSTSISQHRVAGGTALERVKEQLQLTKAILSSQPTTWNHNS